MVVKLSRREEALTLLLYSGVHCFCQVCSMPKPAAHIWSFVESVLQ